MRFRNIATLAIGLGLLLGCSTDPEVNTEVLRDKTIVMCQLQLHPSVQRQELSIQRIRYLVDIAFTQEEEVPFGIEGADVLISGGGNEMVFADSGNGIYRYTQHDSTGRITTGEHYDLHINLQNGEYISSSIITPELTFPIGQDTLLIRPDSVVDWWYEYDTPYPFTLSETGYQDTLHFELDINTVLNYPSSPVNNRRPSFDLYLSGLDREVYQYQTVYDNFMTISTAVDSPAVFMESFSEQLSAIEFQVEHKYSSDYDKLLLDDNWPLDEEYLLGVSNIENAYGIFTTHSYNIAVPFVVRIAP